MSDSKEFVKAIQRLDDQSRIEVFKLAEKIYVQSHGDEMVTPSWCVGRALTFCSVIGGLNSKGDTF